MKTGILLIARMGSKRLTGKHMLEVCGKPIIQYSIDRIKAQFQAEIDAKEVRLFLATSDEKMNQAFEKLTGVTVFYGDIHNIPLRIYQATQKYALQRFILVDGDDILCSVQGMRAVYSALYKGQKYVCTQDLPFGMNSQGFETAFYQKAVSPYFGTKMLETGWGRVFPKGTCRIIKYPKNERHDLLRFTLDYAEDFDLFKTIIEHFADQIITIPEAEVISFVLDTGLYKQTESIMKTYWKRFYEQVEKEEVKREIEDINVLIVGLGSMGKRRIRNLQALGVSHILGFDPRGDRAEEAREKYGIQTACDFLQVRLGEIDRMIISTPPDQHMYYAHMAADYKIPCFIEASVVDTDMLRLIKKQEPDPARIICPSCTFHFHPAIKQIRELILKKAIGQVSNFSYHSGQYLPDWHTWESIQEFYVSNRETGGCREIVPFELSWINHLFGNVNKASGFYSKTISLEADIDDTYSFCLQYQSGVLGSVVVDVVSRVATRRLIINGDQGQIRWDWDFPRVELYQADKRAWTSIPFAAGHAEQGYNANLIEEMYVEEMDTFLQAAEGKKEFPNTLKQDYELLQLLYAIEKSNKGEDSQ